jgi:dTDP-D-glucose 4,6-dehydratase
LRQRELKRKPRKDFKEGLAATIQWYIDNQNVVAAIA